MQSSNHSQPVRGADPVYPFASARAQFQPLGEGYHFLGHVPDRKGFTGVRSPAADIYFHRRDIYGPGVDPVPEIVTHEGKFAPNGEPMIQSSMGPDGDGFYFCQDGTFHLGMIMAHAAGHDLGLSNFAPDLDLERAREVALDAVTATDLSERETQFSAIMAAESFAELERCAGNATRDISALAPHARQVESARAKLNLQEAGSLRKQGKESADPREGGSRKRPEESLADPEMGI